MQRTALYIYICMALTEVMSSESHLKSKDAERHYLKCKIYKGNLWFYEIKGAKAIIMLG